MKKILMCLSLLVFGVVLASCGNNNVDPNDYSIEKEIKVKTDITAEDLEDVEVEVKNFTNIAVDIRLESPSHEEYNMNCAFALALNKGNLEGKLLVDMRYSDLEVYIKDSYICLDLALWGGKVRTKIANAEDFVDDELFSGDFDFQEILETFLDEYDPEECENLIIGYDKNGCLVIDYKDDEVTFRYVLNGYLPVYLYTSADDLLLEIKCSYDKVEIEYPEDFNLEDYEIVDEIDDIL